MESEGESEYYEFFRWLGQKLEVPPHLCPRLGVAWVGSAIALNVVRKMGIGSEDFERQAWPEILGELKRFLEDFRLVEDLAGWELDFLKRLKDEK
jgi:hypothetical protein